MKCLVGSMARWVLSSGMGFGMSLALCAPVAVFAAEESDAAKSRESLEQRLEAAEQRLNEAAREVAELNMSLSPDDGPRFVTRGFAGGVPMSRAVLGINIGPFSESSAEDGVQVVSVSPGGPAEAAGLKADDVLVEINGRKLTRNEERSPRAALLRVMDGISGGDKVVVSYRRAGKVSKAELVAQMMEPPMFSTAVPGPPPPPIPLHPLGNQAFRTGPGTVFFNRLDSSFGATEFVALTPKLSQYFGTDKGLLVVRAPRDSRFKLEDGDVIVSIDGREPTSAAHATRILSSYQPGEKLKLDIVRLKKRTTLEFTVPKPTRMEPSGFVAPDEDIMFAVPAERT